MFGRLSLIECHPFSGTETGTLVNDRGKVEVLVFFVKEVESSLYDVAVQLENWLPATLRDMDGAYDDDVILGDAAGPNPPPGLASGKP